MPIHIIEVKEYECGNCGHRWINRLNGKDGPIPKSCAHCKKKTWLDPSTKFTPREKGLRKRVRGFTRLYYDTITMNPGRPADWPYDLPDIFLNIEPRPTIQELWEVVYPLGMEFTRNKESGLYPPKDPGTTTEEYMVYIDKIIKVRSREFEERRRLMIQSIESRGLTYNVVEGLRKMREYVKEQKELFEKQNPELLALIREEE